MSKQIYVLSISSNGEMHEVIGSYSELSFAQTAAQIYHNDLNDETDNPRDELDFNYADNATGIWLTPPLYEYEDGEVGSNFVQYIVTVTTLDEDVRI